MYKSYRAAHGVGVKVNCGHSQIASHGVGVKVKAGQGERFALTPCIVKRVTLPTRLAVTLW